MPRGSFPPSPTFLRLAQSSVKKGDGRSFGEEMYLNAMENVVVEIPFVSPIPGSTEQVPKRALVTRVDDQVCGVSVYRFNGPGEPTQ